MSFLAELQRRKVLKVGAAYVVAAWLAVQGASIGLPAFDAPSWALRALILVMMLGLPLVLVLTWVFDVTPEGVKIETRRVGNERVYAVAATLVALALGWYFVGSSRDQLEEGRESAGATPAKPAESGRGNSASGPSSPRQAPQKSIAVLAFTDLSPTHDQEYFSDGIAEEILNALARVNDLKVAGRTASFYFKGKNESLRTIGDTLGVAHVLEGSVRKQGDKVRITAQLVKADDGFHLWSETYDGELSDVFELQERIARSITDALSVILVGNQQTRLVPVATRDPEAYALYLQASAIFARRDGARFAEAITELEEAVRRDPQFARAHARLAAIHAVAPTYSALPRGASLEAAEHHARLASELDGTLAEPQAVLAWTLTQQRRYLEARAAFERALALDANDVQANFWLATHLVATGYQNRGTEVLDRLLMIDPLLPNALNWRAFLYYYAGDMESAQRLAERAADAGLSMAGVVLAELANARGETARATAHLAAALPIYLSGFPADANAVIAEGFYGDAQAQAEALAAIDGYLAAEPDAIAGVVVWALIRLGQSARALALAQSRPTNNDGFFLRPLLSPEGRAARRLPEFAEFTRQSGLVELWEKYGAPDACRHVDEGEFACD